MFTLCIHKLHILLFVMKKNSLRLIFNLYILQRIQSRPGISTLDLFRPHCQSSNLCMCQETSTKQKRSVMSVFLIKIFLFGEQSHVKTSLFGNENSFEWKCEWKRIYLIWIIECLLEEFFFLFFRAHKKGCWCVNHSKQGMYHCTWTQT